MHFFCKFIINLLHKEMSFSNTKNDNIFMEGVYERDRNS